MKRTLTDRVAVSLIGLNYRSQNAMLRGLSRVLFPTKKSEYQRILIFRTGSIGDNVCAIPAIVAIRRHFPQAEIHVLTNAGRSDLVSLQQIIAKGVVNRIIDYLGTSRWELIKSLRREKYDLFIEFPHNPAVLRSQFRNMAVARMLGIKSAFGWDVSCAKFLRRYQEKFVTLPGETPRLLDILRRNGIPAGAPEYPFNITSADVEHVEEILQCENLDRRGDNVALVVGAKRPQNRWPIRNFVQIAEHLASRGKNVIIVGGPEDQTLARELTHIDGVHDFTGKLTPMESAALFMRCSFAVTNDTGPMHLAYAVGLPVIALFSSRDYPHRWFPPSDGTNVVFRNNDVHCSICYSETCGNNICMQGIGALEVMREIDAMILRAA